MTGDERDDEQRRRDAEQRRDEADWEEMRESRAILLIGGGFLLGVLAASAVWLAILLWWPW